MKLGRFIPLGTHKNVKIGYGTINHKDLKTIYLKLNSWLEPDEECKDYDAVVRSSRNGIKRLISGLNSDSFRPQSIVDLGVVGAIYRVYKQVKTYCHFLRAVHCVG